MKHKINQNRLDNIKGFNWVSRYSDTNETDDVGRWSRICFYNGLYIGYVSGYASDGEDIRKKGSVCSFITYLSFPTSRSYYYDRKCFKSFKECQKYVEEMFLDFKKIINK